MSRKITSDRFCKIKKFLNTPILVNPPIRYVADKFGYSSGTVSQINRFDTFEEYKKYQTEKIKQYNSDFLANEMNYAKSERERAKKEIDKFNSEWYFKEVKNDI